MYLITAMARLAAHSQWAALHCLTACESGISSSTKSGVALCALRVGKSGRNLEKTSGEEIVCERNETRRKTSRNSGGVHCSRVAAEASAAGAAAGAGAAGAEFSTEGVPWSVTDLEQKFGQAGVKFVEAAGYRIVEMRLLEGSSARVVVQSAMVASYKSRMWHGGLEELLYAAVRPAVDESQRPTMVGGVALKIWEGESDLAAMGSWDVETVRSDPAQYVQVTLSTTSKGHSSGSMLEFRYVFTLLKASLSCALIVTNLGDSAVSIRGSMQTSVSVNFVDGTYALGLQGCKYRPKPEDLSPEKRTKPKGGSLLSRLRWFSGDDEKESDSSIRTVDGMTVEVEEMVRMKGGFDRLYLDSSECVSILDRGKRRTLNFYNTGFGDIRLSNPGEESGLEDWDSFVCVGLAQSVLPVNLEPGQEWRAAQQLGNPSK